NLYVSGVSANTISNFTTVGTSVTAQFMYVRSSVPTRPMLLGDLNNSPVAGTNLSNAELGRIVTLTGDPITFGDDSQTGSITLRNATLATTPGASTNVRESPTGGGQIVL